MSAPTGFAVRTLAVSVAQAHAMAMPVPVSREVWFFEPEDSAVVLGSTQRVSCLSLDVVERRGLGVVRRHSGGGAVVVEPGVMCWFDVFVAAEDPLFERDVSNSALWLGGTVTEALRSIGVDASEPASRPASTDWAKLVCFAGLAPGEVCVGGRKAVGISQRRTRSGSRFQVSVLVDFDADATAALFALDADDRVDLRDRLRRNVCGVDVPAQAVKRAVIASMARLST